MKTVLRTGPAFVTSSLLVLLFCTGLAFAQTSPPRVVPPVPPRSDGTPNQDSPPLSTIEEEMRAKHAIKHAEKEHQENLERAREIAQIGKELRESLKTQAVLDRNSLKKVERLEKLTRKIRGEAGGEDQEELNIPDRPTDVSSAIVQIADASEALSRDVQNTPRQVVSASVIGNANVLLELIKILRAYARQP
jgi:hypothetical protein